MQAYDNLEPVRRTLETLSGAFDLNQRIADDPVELPHRYQRQQDIETAGFIASCLSYGKVALFKPVIERILLGAGTSPYDFFYNFRVHRQAYLFNDIHYRMNTSHDITAFLHLLSLFLRRYGTLGDFFRTNFKEGDPTVLNALSRFVHAFYAGNTSAVYGKNKRPFGLIQMLPSPDKGSTCKRQLMFLRWMVRGGDGVDFGLWTFIPRDRLVLPLDTHTARMAMRLRLTERKSMDMKTAIDITNNLKKFDPDDPVKYDFALCHFGISGHCPARRTARLCSACLFRKVCFYEPVNPSIRQGN